MTETGIRRGGPRGGGEGRRIASDSIMGNYRERAGASQEICKFGTSGRYYGERGSTHGLTMVLGYSTADLNALVSGTAGPREWQPPLRTGRKLMYLEDSHAHSSSCFRFVINFSDSLKVGLSPIYQRRQPKQKC